MTPPAEEEPAEGAGATRRRDRPVPPWVGRVSKLSWAFVGFSIALSIVVVTLATLSELVVPLVVAIVAAVVFAPTVDRLERLHIPRAIGAAAVTLLIVAAAAGIVVLVAVGVVDQADELAERIDAAWRELADVVDTPTISDYFSGLATDLRPPTQTLLQGVGTHIGSLIGSAVGIVSGLVLALVILYYLLKDGRSMVGDVIDRRAPADRAQVTRILQHSAETIRNNARGRTTLAAVQGVAVFLVLAILDVPLAATVGIVNFIGAFVPYLGAFLGGAFAVLMAISEGGVPLALGVLAAVLFVNLVLENLLEPRLIGSSMRLRPVVVLLSTVAGGLVAGLLGLVLGAPLYAIGSNLLRELRSSGFFGGESPVPVVQSPTVDETTEE